MLVQITRENRKNFTGIVPETLLVFLGDDENYYGIGIVPDPSSLPVAALVFYLDIETDDEGEEHKVCDIKWLFVSEEVREIGAATFMFSECMKLIEGSGIEAVRTYVPMDTEYNLLCNVLEGFGFEFDLTEHFELIETLQTIRGSEVLKKRLANKDIVPLSAVPARLFSQGLVEIAEKVDMSDFVLPLYPEAYDMDVSMLYVPDKIPRGFLLVRAYESKVLEIVYLKCDDSNASNIIFELITAAIDACAQKYDDNTTIRATVRTGTAGQLISRILPEARNQVLRRGYFVL
ncbi:MAG: hypothetical protein K6B14_00780 [Lachnospiraceae bacterium]|nr:hypothetical protein [Lachnospiraceae bacterium]